MFDHVAKGKLANCLYIMSHALDGTTIERELISRKGIWEVNKENFDFVHYNYRLSEPVLTLETREHFEIINSFRDGEAIEFKFKTTDPRSKWVDKDLSHLFNFINYDYRKKPKLRELTKEIDGETVLFREVRNDY